MPYKDQEKRRKYMREYHLLRKYKLTPEDFASLLESQGGRCAICRVDITNHAHVDHSHRSTLIRGLLCNTCNRAIGLLHDDATVLRAAADYLERVS